MEKFCKECGNDFSEEVNLKVKSKSWKKEFAEKIKVCDHCINSRKKVAKVHKGNDGYHDPYKYAEKLAGKK